MSDLVSRLLAAIEETERIARDCAGASWVDDVPGMVHVDPAAIRDSKWTLGRLGYVASADNSPAGDAYRRHIVHHDPQAVARRCAADREEVELHAIVWRDIGWLEWDEGEHAEMYEELPVCGLCVPKHSSFPTRADVPEGPCQTIRLRARAYGISVEEETTGE